MGPTLRPQIRSPIRPEAEALARRLPPLLVAAERVAATVAAGLHGRRRTGRGDSFWQFRPYRPGDPAHLIDWRETGKRDRAYVREREWEAAQSVWIWRDASPSMDWRSGPAQPLKAERAAVLALALGILLIEGGERVALLGRGRPPDHGRAALDRLYLGLEAQGKDEGLPPVERLPRGGTLVLIGDFLSPLDGWAERLTRYAGMGLHGHLLHLADPAEEDLPFDGRIRFEGLEGEGEVLIDRVEEVRDLYRRRYADHRAGLADLARAQGWSFASHRTDRPPQTALLALHNLISANAGRFGRGAF